MRNDPIFDTFAINADLEDGTKINIIIQRGYNEGDDDDLTHYDSKLFRIYSLEPIQNDTVITVKGEKYIITPRTMQANEYFAEYDDEMKYYRYFAIRYVKTT